MVRTRLLTVADELSAIGGTEIAQLRIIEGLASTGWAIDLLYVRRGDLGHGGTIWLRSPEPFGPRVCDGPHPYGAASGR